MADQTSLRRKAIHKRYFSSDASQEESRQPRNQFLSLYHPRGFQIDVGSWGRDGERLGQTRLPVPVECELQEFSLLVPVMPG